MSTAGKVHAESLDLPFQGLEPMARQCSYNGAVDASERAGRQALALLAEYAHGPLTDRDAATRLNVGIATICARRNELVKLKLVQAIDTVPGAFRVRNTRWGLAR